MLTAIRDAALTLSILFALSGVHQADVDFDRPTDQAGDRYVSVLMDDSHDLAVVEIDGNEILITVLQFDPDEFPEVPHPFHYSEDYLFDNASNVYEREYSLDNNAYVLLFAEGGNDLIWVAQSYDLTTEVFGGDGNDHLIGGSGRNLLHGEAGNDLISGGPEQDLLYGGPGEDELFGHEGDDVIEGGSEDDELTGGDGRDELWGDEGNDILDGGYDGEIDFLFGGQDADTFVFRRYRLIQYASKVYSKLAPRSYTTGTYTYQHTVEMETVSDFDSKEGDDRVSIRVD
jgi:Ca2+-binding RTX toxin-like protein